MKERIERFTKYMEHKGLNDNQVTVQCGIAVGVIGQARKGKSDLGAKTIAKILEKYQDLNRVWLLTGEGEMLNSDNKNNIMAQDGIRYWEDIPATGGVAEFLSNPEEHKISMIHVPTFRDCTDAVNIYGDSMSPVYKNGEIIILKAWEESFIDFGCCYLIVTVNGNRMVKYLRAGSTPDTVKCVSENKDFDAFEIKKADILKLYLVKGAIRNNSL